MKIAIKMLIASVMFVACSRSLLFLMAMTMSAAMYAQTTVYATPDKNNRKVIKRYNCYNHRWGYPHVSGRAVGYHCYKIYHDGTKYCYYDPERDDTSQVHRVIAIPPHEKKNLSDYRAILTKKGLVSTGMEV